MDLPYSQLARQCGFRLFVLACSKTVGVEVQEMKEKHKTNRYAGKCEHCGKHVPAGTGYVDYEKDGVKRDRGYFNKYRFYVVCKECAPDYWRSKND